MSAWLAARNSNLSTFNAININYSTLTGSTIIGSTLTMISTISVSTIYDSTITTRQMYYSTIIGSSITTSTITAQGISYSTLTGSTITTSTITAQGISYSTLTGSTLATTGVTANSVTVGSTITGSTLTLSGNASVSKAIVGTTSGITLNGYTPSGPLIVYESTGTIVTPTQNAMSASIVVCHGNNYGGSSILFTSTYNPGSDYGYITFIDNVANGSYTRYNYWNSTGAGSETAVLLIGCENDTGYASGPDSVIISPAGNIALDPKGGVTYITGNVGIGTTNPGYTLTVQGAIYASGDITALSDQRYKQNITSLSNSLNTISKITGYSYTRTDYRIGETHIGLLAQEVKEVYPEAVSYDDKNEMYSINYGCLLAPVIESIKELKAQIAAQQEQIQELLRRP